MSIKNIVKSIVDFSGPLGLKVQKVAPEIFLGAGVIGIVTSTVLACRATLKVGKIMDEHKEKVNMIHEATENIKNGTLSTEKYSIEDSKKDLTITYIQTGVEFLKAYGPSIALLGISLGSIIKGHNIMKGRNIALMAAYKGIQEAFNNYRKRVIEEHGKEADYMYKNGIKAIEVTTPSYTDENGVKHKESKTKLMVADKDGISAYARYFNDSCSQWSSSNDYNHFFLLAQQNYFNDILRVRGHVFLNEVYDALGLNRSEAGAIVGWIKGQGDGFIDFGAFDPDTKSYLPLVSSEDGILLDFNVDGVIYSDFTNTKV